MLAETMEEGFEKYLEDKHQDGDRITDDDVVLMRKAWLAGASWQRLRSATDLIIISQIYQNLGPVR